MDNTTDKQQDPVTPTDDKLGGKEPVTPTDKLGGNNEPVNADPDFKVFKTKEDFDNHSAGIKRSAEKEAEKKIMAMLGLNPDEKDKLAEYRKTYEASLSEAEKQVKTIETLTSEVSTLKNEIAEKDAIIATLSKVTGKTTEEFDDITKMARSLVSDTVTIDEALEKVFKLIKPENKVPKGTPPVQTEPTPATEVNPFAKETFNMTEQGRLMNTDPDKARRLYAQAYGKNPNW